MFNLKFLQSFRFRLIYYFTSVTLITIIIFAITYITSFNRTIKDNIINNSVTNLTYISNAIDANILSAHLTSLWFGENGQLIDALMDDGNNKSPAFMRRQLDVQALFLEQISKSIIGKYILSVNAAGVNGLFFNSGNQHYSIPRGSVGWFDELKKVVLYGDESDIFNRVVKTPYAADDASGYVIPIVLPARNAYTGKPLGVCTVLFDEKIITDVFGQYAQSNTFFYVLNQSGICIASTDKAMINTAVETDYMDEIRGKREGYLEIGRGKGRKLVIFSSNSYKLTVVQEIYLQPLLSNNKFLSSTTIGMTFTILAVTLLLHLYLSKMFVHPINMLLLKMKEIAVGNFHSGIRATANDELGVLEDGIDNMALQIESFIEQKMLQEQEKKELEIRVLQSQINPHFLYNTLNSIKFMATAQKASGIAECVGALARLLRSVYKHGLNEITIAEELSLTKDYFFIQRIRYTGNIDMDIEADEALMQCKILKFTLQPIIENAIFHGIEPTGRPGRISVKISDGGDSVVISITDDGAGIDEDVLENIKNNRPPKLSSVGIKNVHERIRLTYGDSYGLAYESKKDKYTKAVITIPKI